MGDVPEKALGDFLRWAVSYEARLPDADGSGILAAEFRAYVTRLACESVPAAEPPFDLHKAALGELPPNTPVTGSTLLSAMRHHLYVTKDASLVELAGELTWNFFRQVTRAEQS